MHAQAHSRHRWKYPHGNDYRVLIEREIISDRRIVMELSEPPSSRPAALPRLFRIGRDSRGRWVAKDQHGLCGGLFIGRAEALKFAMFENGNCPHAVIMVPGVLELDIGSEPRSPARLTVDCQSAAASRAVSRTR
jgi:hypothetical protein